MINFIFDWYQFQQRVEWELCHDSFSITLIDGWWICMNKYVSNPYNLSCRRCGADRGLWMGWISIENPWITFIV